LISTESISNIRSSTTFAAVKSPPSVIYELAGREVSDCGVQSDGPRVRASAAAAPITSLLQTIKPQSARVFEAAEKQPVVASETLTNQPRQQLDLIPHKVRLCPS
jgi:hypothetical protein